MWIAIALLRSPDVWREYGACVLTQRFLYMPGEYWVGQGSFAGRARCCSNKRYLRCVPLPAAVNMAISHKKRSRHFCKMVGKFRRGGVSRGADRMQRC